MEFLAKIVYYAVTAVSGLLVGFFFLANLFGQGTGVERTMLLVAGTIGLSGIAWAVAAGHGQGHWLLGTGISAGSVIAAAVVMFGGMLAFHNGSWQ